MTIGMKERSFGTLLLIVVIGILIGSYLNLFVAMLPGGENVVKTFFTHSFINFGIGDFDNNKPVLLDLYAIKFQIGFQLKFSLLSILGVFVGLYFFRWYK
jgi:hypothetical protein